MNRYFTSFIATLLIYASSLASVLYIAKLITKHGDSKALYTKCPSGIEPNKIKFTVLAEVAQIKKASKPKEKEAVQKVLKKPEPPKKIKKKVPKKIVQKKPLPKKIQKNTNEIVEPKIVKKEHESSEQAVAAKSVKNMIQRDTVIASQASKIELENKRTLFLKDVRERINENKSYPRRARKMGIEGVVSVSFVILADGSISNIHVSGAHKVLQESVRESIEESFPVSVPKDLDIFPLSLSLELDFSLSH